jgi:hypothetical protein
VELHETRHGSRLKTRASVYQYQRDQDPESERWVFRYEYLREPRDEHPTAHLHVKGTLDEPTCLPPRTPLERIHFVTHRVSIEAVIRVLIEQFSIDAPIDAAVWRSALATSEKEFLDHAHRPESGPSE